MSSDRIVLRQPSSYRGLPGVPGLPGTGGAVPAGGTTGQVLTKRSGTDGDADWENAPSGGGGGGAVASVNGRTGAVTLAKADVGLGSVDNTADTTKQVLSATKLKTPRSINAVPFDGTADITVSAATGEYTWVSSAAGVYPAAPSTKPVGTLYVLAMGPIDPAQAGATIPTWAGAGTGCPLFYEWGLP